jgi:hypothetical protein
VGFGRRDLVWPARIMKLLLGQLPPALRPAGE